MNEYKKNQTRKGINSLLHNLKKSFIVLKIINI